jgi:hypothetical protein
MHELFFGEFPCILHEWLKRQACYQFDHATSGANSLGSNQVDSLKELEKRWTREIDFWFTQVKEGYIIEFTIQYCDSLE